MYTWFPNQHDSQEKLDNLDTNLNQTVASWWGYDDPAEHEWEREYPILFQDVEMSFDDKDHK